MPWIKRLLTSLFLLTLSTAPALADEGWETIDPPIPTSAPEGKIEVVEFFWYGCPHCFGMEPQLQAWLKTKPDNVEFRRIPSPLNPSWTVHAQFFYAAEALGVLEQLHEPLFEAIHVKKRKLFDKNSLIDFAVEHGVDRQKFSDAWNSFGVYVKVQQARTLGQRYALDGVPAIGIDGRYKTSGSQAGTYTRMFEIVNQLIAGDAKPAQ